jgi:hypothetical protein
MGKLSRQQIIKEVTMIFEEINEGTLTEEEQALHKGLLDEEENINGLVTSFLSKKSEFLEELIFSHHLDPNHHHYIRGNILYRQNISNKLWGRC